MTMDLPLGSKARYKILVVHTGRWEKNTIVLKPNLGEAIAKKRGPG
jgi:hypothetical protein